MERRKKIKFTESRGSSRFFVSKSGVFFSFWPLFRQLMVVSVITEIMDFLRILSLEFEYNATRVLAKPTKHKNKH